MVRFKLGLGILSLLILSVYGPFDLKAAEKERFSRIVRADELAVGVARMHQLLLSAVRSGEIDNLRDILQMNELMPLIDGKFIHDPVTFWKSGSADEGGFDLLALLSEILELPPVKRTANKEISYIWPYFAGVPLDKLKGPELVRLYRLAPASDIAMMRKLNRYTGAVLSLGADGTWHFFSRKQRP